MHLFFIRNKEYRGVDMSLGKWVCPPKIAYLRRFNLIKKSPRLADVGCGNDSPAMIKSWIKDCYYIGIDIQRYNNSDESVSLIDQFVQVTPEGDGYDAIPDGSLDIIIMHHVVEHIREPGKVIVKMCDKLKSGGAIWIAFPSVRSLAFPSAKGTLQFCDDDSHLRVVDVKEVANLLLDHGFKVVHGGRTHDVFRTLLGIAMLPLARIRKLLTGEMRSLGLWYIYGFEDHVVAVKR